MHKAGNVAKKNKIKIHRLIINLQKLPIGINLHGSPLKIKLAKMQSIWKMCRIKNEPAAAASISSTWSWTRFPRSSEMYSHSQWLYYKCLKQ